VQQAREAARRSQCKNNLKQLALALHNYHDSHRQFPINYANWARRNPADGSSVSWMVLILPYVDQQPLCEIVDFSVGVRNDPRDNGGGAPGGTGNLSVAMTPLPVYKCPTDTSPSQMRGRA